MQTWECAGIVWVDELWAWMKFYKNSVELIDLVKNL